MTGNPVSKREPVVSFRESTDFQWRFPHMNLRFPFVNRWFPNREIFSRENSGPAKIRGSAEPRLSSGGFHASKMNIRLPRPAADTRRDPPRIMP
jgi:hypothetical protein